MTKRQIHKHFSDNFGPIHRIYFGRDFHELHSDYKSFIQNLREEQAIQLDCERKYMEMRFRVNSSDSSNAYNELN